MIKYKIDPFQNIIIMQNMFEDYNMFGPGV